MPTDTEQRCIAVFDFCETLADFQTANAFVDYAWRQHRTCRAALWRTLHWLLTKSRVMRVLRRMPGLGPSVGKLMKLRQLEGMPQAALEKAALDFYTERVRPHLIGRMVDELRRLQAEGCMVGLSSGGYDIYLKHFAAEYGLDFCHCSEIGFRDGRCTGRLTGEDCMREEKVRRLSATFGSANGGSVAYSDSPSDLPLLQWAAEGVVVSRGAHQPWADTHKFKEIIW